MPQALQIIVMRSFSRGNLCAFTNFPSFFILQDGDHERIGFIFMGNLTDVPWPSSLSLYHQFSRKYFILPRLSLWNKVCPRCSDGTPLSHVTFLQTSRSTLTYKGNDVELFNAEATPEQNCRQASCSLSSVMFGLL